MSSRARAEAGEARRRVRATDRRHARGGLRRLHRSRGQEAFYGQDDPGWIVRSQCDLRVGGVWSVDFGPSPRELYRHRHVFEVIERPHRLVLASTETRLDGSSFHTKLEFTFEAKGEKTLITMTQRGFPTAELRDEHAPGLPNAFARLERLIQLSGTPTDTRHDRVP